MGSSRRKVSNDILYNTGFDHIGDLLKRSMAMAETKLVSIILNLLGIPITLWAFWQNLGDIKAAVLFLLALTFLMIRIYFFVEWAKQKTRKNEEEIERAQIENLKMRQELEQQKPKK